MDGEDIELVSKDGQHFGAFVVQPRDLPAPGIIILQEILGVNGFIRSIVSRFASEGYIAIAPKLFWRQQAAEAQLDADNEQDMIRARQLRDGFNEKLALDDCASALQYLRASADCTGKVGAMGFCLGGKLAYLMAIRCTVDAAVAYYGTGIHRALGEAPGLRAPVLLHIAGDDFLCPPDAQAQIIDRLGALRGTVRTEMQTHVYAGVNHGFARIGKTHYSEAETKLADSRTARFLQTHLRSPDTA
jgi:carboxymethylenebutenolidase